MAVIWAAPATGNSKGLFTLPQQHCTNVWKYKNIAFTLEKCSNALKAVIERLIAEAEAKTREAKEKKEREKKEKEAKKKAEKEAKEAAKKAKKKR